MKRAASFGPMAIPARASGADQDRRSLVKRQAALVFPLSALEWPIGSPRKHRGLIANLQNSADCYWHSLKGGKSMAKARTPTRLQDDALKSPALAQALPSEAVLDELKMMLIGAPLNEVLTSVTRLIEAHSEGMLCSIFLVEEDGLHLRYAAAPNLPETYRAGTDRVCIGPNVGSCGTAAYLRQPVFVSDILSDPKWAKYRNLALQSGLRAAWSSPIMSHDGNVLGTFCIYYREVRQPTPAEIQLIDYASRIAGIAIERHRTQSALQQAYRELRQLIDFLPQQVIVLDAAGFLVQANQMLLDYYGRTFEEMRGAGTAERVKRDVHPDDFERVRSERQSGLATGAPFEIEKRMLGKDGRYRWFLFRYKPMLNEEGAVLSWYATATDIEDRKRTEEELRGMIDAVAQTIVVLNPDGRVTYANRAALEYIGLSLDEVRSEDFRARVFHPEDVQRVREAREKGLSGTMPFENEQRALGKNGKYRWFLIRYNPLLDESGKVIRWYATGTDIDDRKQAEQRMRNENLALREEIDRSSMYETIVGSSEALRQVLAQVDKVAATDSTVLILGETGTGKELIASAIHKRSRRAARAFIRVNCAAIPTSLIASELFGHEKGAFTGALQRRAGRFESADGGTIFLDEVGELSPETQLALLRVLQERELERVGSNQPIPVDVRVVAATNRDLEAAVSAGTLRQDLFYRINVFPVRIPPLRERKDDIPLLVEYLVERYTRRAGKRISHIEKKTLDILTAYAWPGNVRELQNVVERAVILCDGETFFVDETWLQRRSNQHSGRQVSRHGVFAEDKKEFADRERQAIEAALVACQGRVSGPRGAAAMLGIPHQTLESKIVSLGIDKRRFKVRSPGRSSD
jgi:formate hydrogenlyase transcriptional activator